MWIGSLRKLVGCPAQIDMCELFVRSQRVPEFITINNTQRVPRITHLKIPKRGGLTNAQLGMDIHPSQCHLLTWPGWTDPMPAGRCKMGAIGARIAMVFVGKISENDDKATKLSFVSPILLTNPCKMLGSSSTQSFWCLKG